MRNETSLIDGVPPAPLPTVSYCINHKCHQRENSLESTHCQGCGSSLIIQDRYRIIRPLRFLNSAYPTDIFEIKDWGTQDWGTSKVIKVLKYSNNPTLVRLFQREARVLMWLRNPGIPQVEPDGYFTLSIPGRSRPLHCLVMELIEGENLQDWLEKNGQISQSQALNWLEQIVAILGEIHHYNLLHRDLKPSNLILRPNGQIALIDFGTVGEANAGETRVGTNGYVAPEQLEGKAVPASDFFALGRTLVHLLTDRSPVDFPEHPKTGKLFWRDHALVSAPFADLLDHMMSPRPDHRPQNTQILQRKLTRLITGKSTFSLASFGEIKWAIWVTLAILGIHLVYNWQSGRIQIDHHFSSFLNQKGQEKFQKNQFYSAQFYFELALKINPENGKALYNLGSVCEEKRDFNCAQKNYQLALENADPKVIAYAANNLGRLKIMQGDYLTAQEHLLKAWEHSDVLPENDPVRSTLNKNLGWMFLSQHNYVQAEARLRQAIELPLDQAAAYCLLAQTLEAQGKQAEALASWRACITQKAEYNPEVQPWQFQGCQRLQQLGESCELVQPGERASDVTNQQR